MQEMNPPPQISGSDERLWAMLASLLVLPTTFVLGCFGWIPTLIIYLNYRERSKFVAFHALQSLFFQGAVAGTTVIGYLVANLSISFQIPSHSSPQSGIVAFAAFLFGLAALAIYFIVASLVIGIRANQGELAMYPIVGKIARRSIGI